MGDATKASIRGRGRIPGPGAANLVWQGTIGMQAVSPERARMKATGRVSKGRTMALKSMIVEFGTGADIRGGDYTKAAVRALQAALGQNSIAVADAFGVARDAMHVKIVIGVAKPDRVDRDAVAAVLPYGRAEVVVEEGGMDIELESGLTVMANAAATSRSILPTIRSVEIRRERRSEALAAHHPRDGNGHRSHGEDYTKAARRAVEDAIRHSSLTLFASLRIDPDSMRVDLRLAAQEPERIDLAAVAEILPFGHVTAKASKGGLNIPDETSGRACVIVNAAVVVRLALQPPS
jgi:uncharacterized protein (TIGR02058 family)